MQHASQPQAIPPHTPRRLHWLLASLCLGCLLHCVQAPLATPPQAPPAAPQAPSPPHNPKLPTLRVGTSGDYAPYSLNGAGFDIEVAQRMASDLGYQIEWVPFTWPTLTTAVTRQRFDIAMGGITWRPERALLGTMTRAVHMDGPCELHLTGPSPAGPLRIGVNRGGFLEQWTRGHFPNHPIHTVTDNNSLPELLASGQVDLIITDSSEAQHFMRPNFVRHCHPPRNRKVYWVTTAAPPQLAANVDHWLATHEATLSALRHTWLKQSRPWTPTQHLIDLLGRRLALMPAVAASKRTTGTPIADPAREQVVISQALEASEQVGLNKDSVRALFTLQIQLAKAIQKRGPSWQGPAPDLKQQLRPTLSQLGSRIVMALSEASAELPMLTLADLDLLAPWLTDNERAALLNALQQVRLQAP